MDTLEQLKQQQLLEIMRLINIGNRKNINRWKDEKGFWTRTLLHADKICNDVDVIYNLCKFYNEETNEICLKNSIMDYVKYIDDDPFNSEVKWINTNKKLHFFQSLNI